MVFFALVVNLCLLEIWKTEETWSTGRSEQQLAALKKKQICEMHFLSEKETANLSANTELAKIWGM